MLRDKKNPVSIPSAIERLETRRMFSGMTYYVSPSGNDSGLGTSSSAPWKTIARADKQTFHPGDSLLLQGGATFSGKLVLGSNDAGTLAAPVLVGSFGSGRATIAAGNGDGIDITDAGGIDVFNIVVAGDGTNLNTSTGIKLLDDQVNKPRFAYININNVDVSYFGRAGIGVESNTLNTGFSNVSITNSTVHNNGHSGIWTQAGPDATPAPYGLAHQYFYIGNVVAYNNPGYAGNDASGNGIQLGNMNGALIEHCIAFGNGTKNTSTGGGPIGIWAYNSNNVVMQYNQSYSNTAGHKDGGGFDLDGGVTNSYIQYNYSHDNAGAGYLEAQFAGGSPSTDNTIRYNISQNDGRMQSPSQAGIYLWAASSSNTVVGTQIYNNTVYMIPPAKGTATGILIAQTMKNVVIRNNIIDVSPGMKTVTVKYSNSGTTFQGNDYWAGSAAAIGISWGSATYQTLAAWRAATGEEMLGAIATGLAVGPQLNIASATGIATAGDVIYGTASFQLQPGSPVASAGLNLRSLGINPGDMDLFSSILPLNTPPALGAYQPVSHPAAATSQIADGLMQVLAKV